MNKKIIKPIHKTYFDARLNTKINQTDINIRNSKLIIFNLL